MAVILFFGMLEFLFLYTLVLFFMKYRKGYGYQFGLQKSTGTIGYLVSPKKATAKQRKTLLYTMLLMTILVVWFTLSLRTGIHWEKL